MMEIERVWQGASSVLPGSLRIRIAAQPLASTLAGIGRGV